MKQISAKQKQANFFRGMAELADRGEQRGGRRGQRGVCQTVCPRFGENGARKVGKGAIGMKLWDLAVYETLTLILATEYSESHPVAYAMIQIGLLMAYGRKYFGESK